MDKKQYEDFVRRVVAHEVSDAFGVSEDSIYNSRARGRKASTPPAVAVYMAHIVFALSVSDAARIFCRQHSGASYTIARIEDLRDNPGFEELLAKIEKRLSTRRRLRFERVNDGWQGPAKYAAEVVAQ